MTATGAGTVTLSLTETVSALAPTDVLVVIFVAASVFFTFVGALGVLRLPDLYTRAHAASKADTLGAGFGIAAVMMSFGFGRASLKAGLLLVFVYVTGPTAAHAISRAAYDQGIEPWVKGNEDGNEDREGEGEEKG